MNLNIFHKKKELVYSQQYAMEAVKTAQTYIDARMSGRDFIYSGGKTFLNGLQVNDDCGRGMIDCSTYIYLVLLGIPYEKSPYCTGNTELQPEAVWADKELQEVKLHGTAIRYAADLAEYYWNKGRCFTDASLLKPGDLTFHSSKRTKRFHSVTHVGIISEDTSYFLNVTNVRRTVVRSAYSCRNDYVFFARPEY